MSAWLVAVLVPIAICVGAISLLRRAPSVERLADHPNERSLHTEPRPRIGGIGIVVAAVPVGLHFSTGSLDLAWVLALGLAVVSFADDLRSLPIAVRISAHLAASGIVVAALLPSLQEGHLLIAVMTMLALAWGANLYNFMDGADGLAGGMGFIGFTAYAVAAAQAGATDLSWGSAAVASACAAFLSFNFPPARVFMGDAGSIPLGFLAGALGVHGVVASAWPWWFPLLVFSPFIVDSSVTLARRVLRREQFWRAHRDHYYQRLVLGGWSSRALVHSSYALMTAACASALIARAASHETRCVIIVAWSVFYVVTIVTIERRGASQSATG